MFLQNPAIPNLIGGRKKRKTRLQLLKRKTQLSNSGVDINLTSKMVVFGDTTQCVYYSTFGSMSTQCKPLCTKAAEKV